MQDDNKIDDDSSDDDDEDEEEATLSAHVYARRHGLARPYDADDPRETLGEMKLRWLPLFNEDQREREDKLVEGCLPLAASGCLDRVTQMLLSEKLDVTNGVAGLLFEITKGSETNTGWELVDDKTTTPEHNDSHRTQKLILPLLQTDEEVDLHRASRLTAPSINKRSMKRFRVDEQADEGLEWSRISLELPQKMMDALAAERLDVTRDALEVIRSVVVEDWYEKDCLKMSEEEPRSKKVGYGLNYYDHSLIIGLQRRKPNPITPPLSPLRVQRTLISSSPIEIDFLPWSEVDDPDTMHLRVLEDNMFQQDDLTEPTDEHSGKTEIDMAQSTFLNSDMMTSSDALYVRPVLLCKYEMELPLLPNAVQPDQNAETAATAIQSTCKLEDLIWYGQTDDALLDAMTAMIPHATRADLMVQQETLSSKDSRLRVEVPHVMPVSFTAPWDLYNEAGLTDVSQIPGCKSAQRLYVDGLGRSKIWDFSSWAGASSLERSMQWKPFSDRAAKHAIDESIDDSEFMTSIMECMTLTDVVTSDAEAWKPDGLRILDEDMDGGQLELADLGSICNDLEDLVRQKQLEMVASDHNHGGTGRMAGQLQRFLSSNGIQLPQTSPACPSKPVTIDPRLAGRQVKAAQKATTPITSLTLPPLPPTSPATHFIISAEVTRSRRGLYRRLQTLSPSADFVERDFESTDSRLNRQYDDSAAFFLAEADVVLSPSSGLIMTNMQKIQQLSLPGAGPQINPFHEHITRLADRYEKIVILVCQTLVETSRICNTGEASATAISAAPPMTLSDIKALTALNALVSNLAANITVQLVPGGERELAGWAAFYMSKVQTYYDVPIDESHWERLLRRAGMDAFAACVVLAMLGSGQEVIDADNTTNQQQQSDSLKLFVRMHPDERIALFAGVFGGERVLSRVNACLEKGWISASRDFKTYT